MFAYRVHFFVCKGRKAGSECVKRVIIVERRFEQFTSSRSRDAAGVCQLGRRGETTNGKETWYQGDRRNEYEGQIRIATETLNPRSLTAVFVVGFLSQLRLVVIGAKFKLFRSIFTSI